MWDGAPFCSSQIWSAAPLGLQEAESEAHTESTDLGSAVAFSREKGRTYDTLQIGSRDLEKRDLGSKVGHRWISRHGGGCSLTRGQKSSVGNSEAKSRCSWSVLRGCEAVCRCQRPLLSPPCNIWGAFSHGYKSGLLLVTVADPPSKPISL